jgi:hypothetical protein
MLLWNPTNAQAKLKIRGHPAGTIQLMLFSSFFLVQAGVSKTLAVLGQKRWSLKL